MSIVTTGKVGVCNAALIRLGENTISSFTDGSLEANACSVLYDSSRREMLESHPWRFAVKRSSWDAATESGGLSRTASTAPVNIEYKYEYTLPSDCIKLLKVYQDGDYKLEGRNIITSSEECHIKYIYDDETTTNWSPVFRKVMEAKMAYELSYVITRQTSSVEQFAALLDRTLMTAKAMDSQQDIIDPIDQFESSLIAARRSTGGY